MALQKAKKTKKGRKHGRNKLFCQMYRNEDRRAKSHVARLKKHIASQPNDLEALEHLARFNGIITGSNAVKTARAQAQMIGAPI